MADIGYILNGSASTDYEHTNNNASVWLGDTWHAATQQSGSDWWMNTWDGTTPAAHGDTGGWAASAVTSGDAEFDTRASVRPAFSTDPTSEELHMLSMHTSATDYDRWQWQSGSSNFAKEVTDQDPLTDNMHQGIVVDSLHRTWVIERNNTSKVLRARWRSTTVSTWTTGGAIYTGAGAIGDQRNSPPYRFKDDDGDDAIGFWAVEDLATDTIQFYYRKDSALTTAAWTVEDSGIVGYSADDHCHAVSGLFSGDTVSTHVVAAKQTTGTYRWIKRDPAGVFTSGELTPTGATRVKLAMDVTNNVVYAFYTESGDVVYRTAPADEAIVFSDASVALSVDVGSFIDDIGVPESVGLTSDSGILILGYASPNVRWRIIPIAASSPPVIVVGNTRENNWHIDSVGGGDGTGPLNTWTKTEFLANQAASVNQGDKVWLIGELPNWQDLAADNATAANSITFDGAYPGFARAFFNNNGGGAGPNQVLDVDGVSNINLRNIKIDADGMATGLRIIDSDNIGVSNIDVHGSDNDCVQIKRCNDVIGSGTFNLKGSGDRYGSGTGLGRGLSISGQEDHTLTASNTYSNIDFSAAIVYALDCGRRGVTVSGHEEFNEAVEYNLQNVTLGTMYIEGNGSGLEIDATKTLRCAGRLFIEGNNLTGIDSVGIDQHVGISIREVADCHVNDFIVTGHSNEAIYVTGSAGRSVTDLYIYGGTMYNNDIAETRAYDIYIELTGVDTIYFLSNYVRARQRHFRMPEIGTQGYVANNIFDSGDEGLRIFSTATANWGVHNNIFRGVGEPFKSTGGAGHTIAHTNNAYFDFTQFDYINETTSDKDAFEPTNVDFNCPIANQAVAYPNMSVPDLKKLNRNGTKYWSGGFSPFQADGALFPDSEVPLGPYKLLGLADTQFF